jgi:hypothetical protein
VTSAASLRRRVFRLEARRGGSSGSVPDSRAEFARALGLDPDPWQGRLLRSEATRVLLNCSRQSGKSTTSAVVALHTALSQPGSLVLALAPALRQSQELFQKISAFYRKVGGMPADSTRKLGVELANGSRIEALPGTERTVRGFSGASLLLVDEAARVDDGLYYAVRPMLAVSGGRLMMLSTPFGKRGVFFEEWTDGEGWERYEVPASECPRIPSAFLEEERRSLPDWVYRQEYGCEFTETDDQVFGYDLVQGSISPEVKPLFEEAG